MSNIDIDQLTALIEKTVQERTLSLEANSRVEDLKAQNKELAESNKVLQDNYQKVFEGRAVAEKARSDLKDKVDSLTKELHDVKTMIASYEKRLFDLSVGERVVEVEHKRRDDIFQLVSLIFKNPIVKETVIKTSNFPVPMASGEWASQGNSNETVTTTTEKE